MEKKPFILIAEDEEDTANALSMILRRAGYDVQCVGDGMDVINLITANRNTSRQVDILVTDLQMPGLTGFELVDEIIRTNQNLPILIVTGYGDEETHRILEEQFHLPYIVKPFTPEKVLEFIQETLRNPIRRIGL